MIRRWALILAAVACLTAPVGAAFAAAPITVLGYGAPVLMEAAGPVLFGFGGAISFGILVGTYSSIFVAAPMLIHLPGKLPGQERTEASGPAET